MDNGLHKCDFANFTKHNICDSLILCGDNGENQNFNIIVNNDRKLTTQISPKLMNSYRNAQSNLKGKVRERHKSDNIF